MEVFNSTVQPLLAQLRQGYNSTCFAYGMTGAGKTHTMFGTYQKNNAKSSASSKPQTKSAGEYGIANLAIEELFKQTEDHQKRPTITVNFLEIYNEQVKDLLWTNQTEN